MKVIKIEGNQYELVKNHKEGWNEEAFLKRYSEILSKYDFIVGDWGYGQLRLKGFFSDQNPRATRETKMAHFEEYLHEFCNFGCAYFVMIRRKEGAPSYRGGKGKPRERTAAHRSSAY